MKIIELRNICKKYEESFIFENLSLEIKKGEFLGIMGKSGSGKTTLLNIIGVIDTQSSGDIYILGRKNPKINSKKAMMLRRNEIGYLLQNYGLIDDRTVEWNLNLALEYKKLEKKARLEKIRRLLSDFDLDYLLGKKIFQLSGGEQQRIAILKLILQETNIILADEPTSNLDEDNEKIVMDYLIKLNQEGKTVVIVTHNKNLINYCSRIIKLN